MFLRSFTMRFHCDKLANWTKGTGKTTGYIDNTEYQGTTAERIADAREPDPIAAPAALTATSATLTAVYGSDCYVTDMLAGDSAMSP